MAKKIVKLDEDERLAVNALTDSTGTGKSTDDKSREMTVQRIEMVIKFMKIHGVDLIDAKHMTPKLFDYDPALGEVTYDDADNIMTGEGKPR